MKNIILLTLTALFLTACNFTIIGEDDSEVVLEERNITIVKRNITIEELSGKWVLEEESISRYLKVNRFKGSRLEARRKSLESSYVNIEQNSTASFLNRGGKSYKGIAKIESMKEWKKANIGYFLYIPYKVDSWKSKDLYFLKLNGNFYLGEKYYSGEEENNTRRTHYLLYRKVKIKGDI